MNVEEAIRQAEALSPEELAAMKARARATIHRNYRTFQDGQRAQEARMHDARPEKPAEGAAPRQWTGEKEGS